jgi:hypothetical protein
MEKLRLTSHMMVRCAPHCAPCVPATLADRAAAGGVAACTVCGGVQRLAVTRLVRASAFCAFAALQQTEQELEETARKIAGLQHSILALKENIGAREADLDNYKCVRAAGARRRASVVRALYMRVFACPGSCTVTRAACALLTCWPNVARRRMEAHARLQQECEYCEDVHQMAAHPHMDPQTTELADEVRHLQEQLVSVQADLKKVRIRQTLRCLRTPLCCLRA